MGAPGGNLQAQGAAVTDLEDFERRHDVLVIDVEDSIPARTRVDSRKGFCPVCRKERLRRHTRCEAIMRRDG